MNQVVLRLEKLRAVMKEQGIDAYLIPTSDFHQSEYVGEYFSCRKYMTGFTGSAGTCLVMQDMAGLWTDARYFIQAELQLQGSGITLFKMREKNVPELSEFLRMHLKKGETLGYDGRCVSVAESSVYHDMEESLGIRICDRVDLVGEIWEDRPDLSSRAVWELPLRFSGMERSDKFRKVREVLKKNHAESLLLTALEDIAWLLNLRGDDIPCMPVFLSNLFLTEKEAHLFADERAFSEEIKAALSADGVILHPYADIYTCLPELARVSSVYLCPQKVNSRLEALLPEDVKRILGPDPTSLLKAMKNDTEVANTRIAHIRDGAAMTKMLYRLKTRSAEEEMTELSVARELNALRAQQPGYVELSFEPIVSYGAHAAMNHYSPTEETDIPIEPKGFLLIDSGGHYMEGSTDVTRTIVMGELTEEERTLFTLVLIGHLHLADARFLYGCSGINLDYLAREPLWRRGLDFKHGTGHGVGYLLSVHEGPNGFRWRKLPDRDEMAVLEEGMITSNEPGYYVEGRYGIRHENMLVCRKDFENEFGTFMRFEDLTLVPFDLDGLDLSLMSEQDRALLNAYHKNVAETLAPYLTPQENAWLLEATRPV